MAITNTFIQPSGVKSNILAYSYNIFYVVGFICSLIAMTQTVLASMFGPSKALLALAHDAVSVAADQMREVQIFVVRLGFIAIISLICGRIWPCCAVMYSIDVLQSTTMYFTAAISLSLLILLSPKYLSLC